MRPVTQEPVGRPDDDPQELGIVDKDQLGVENPGGFLAVLRLLNDSDDFKVAAASWARQLHDPRPGVLTGARCMSYM